MPDRQRLIVFAPLPPMPNGIADYAAETLRPLARRFDCTVVVEDGRTGLTAPPGVRVIEAFRYRRDRAAFDGALHLYHLGNNPDHVYMLPLLWERPGLVVLHDPSLHHLLDCATVALGETDRYHQALQTEYGAPGRILAEQFARYWLRERRMHYDMPMIRTICGQAPGVIVHSRYAAAKVLAQAPDATVTVTPHQFSPPPMPSDAASGRDAVRASLGVGQDEILFLSIGFAGRVKAIDSALRALARIRTSLPPFRYVVAGKLVPEDLDVMAMARGLGIADRIIATGYVAEEDFFPILRAADVVINLRNPIGGETSGTLIRALGSGCCVVVVDRGPFAEIPDGAAVKIPWDGAFEERLAEELLALARDPARRREIGARARAHTVAANSLEATMAGYVRAIEAAGTSAPQRWATAATWHIPAPHAQAALVREATRAKRPAGALPLWFTAGAVPRSATPCRALLVGGDDGDDSLLRDALGQAPERWKTDRFLGTAGPERRSCDLILVSVAAEALAGREEALMRRLNAALRFGGIAVVHVTALDARAGETGAFFRRGAGEALFEAAGFRLDTAAPAAPAEAALPVEDLDHRNPVAAYCWSGTKLSEFIASPREAA